MKEIYKIILELTSRKIQMGNSNCITIAPGGENYQQFWAYSVRKSQSKRDACWKSITA